MMRFGLIGHPLEGSGSPELFRKAYDGRWPYDLIESASFEDSWKRFLSDYQAINITAPFKEAAFERILADGGSVSEDAAAIGAVNIAVKSGEGSKEATGSPAADGIVGYNSDSLGVRALLSRAGFGDGDVAIVAGFGGAGKAAAAAARSLGMDVTVCNRSRRTLADGSQTRPLEELPVLCAVADILIYTLAMPLEQAIGDGVAVPAGGLDCGSVSDWGLPAILEANYRTPCLEGAAEHYISGREWLLEQARAGYALMTGERPEL